MTEYFTADLHLGHEKLQREHRAEFYADVHDMDEKIIEAINESVLPGDILWILGDFAWHRHFEYRKRIYCNNVKLVRGNHDPKMHMCLGFFQGVHDIVYGKKLHGKSMTLCHYPMQAWAGKYQLHGHWHNPDADPPPNRFNVGWDLWFRPITFRDLLDWDGNYTLGPEGRA